MTPTHTRTAALSALALGSALPLAAASAGTFAGIAIDGDFGDWDAVPVAVTDPVDGTPIDYASLKVANDAENLYVLVTYAAATNPQGGSGNFTVIDSDGDVSTGFDPFGLGVIGSNAAFQNDFPFTQTAGNFNSGGTLTAAGPLYTASPYNAVTLQQEIAYPLSTVSADASAGGFNGPVFGGSFSIGFFTDQGSGDIVVTPYDVAAVPEPASLALLGLGATALLGRRRTR